MVTPMPSRESATAESVRPGWKLRDARQSSGRRPDRLLLLLAFGHKARARDAASRHRAFDQVESAEPSHQASMAFTATSEAVEPGLQFSIGGDRPAR